MLAAITLNHFLVRQSRRCVTTETDMPAYLTDDPAVTISVSMDRYTLNRLNTAARLCPEANSRSELVRDLLNLALDTLLEPEIMLPIIVASIREQRALEAETETAGPT